ncbi:MAG: serine/threonine-protein kinase, partial [Kofleriaceae bacterium]
MTCLDDDTVLGLVEGRLAPPVLATVDEHLDACASCRDVVTQVARSLSPARTLERGETVGRYVIGDLVGAGAMGRVYSAWEPELDRRVALKLLTATDPDARDRVIREAKAMAKLDHPNVVGVHEVGTADNAVYVAMELVEGDTLRAYSSTPHPWRETAALLADIARGLAAVHAAGVIHRDVKPDNIVVGRDHRARLADFGLARAGSSPSSPSPTLAAGSIDTPAASTSLAGTPAYMAPEVADGGSATAASDQFSFGVTAYEALSGARPFPASTFSALRAAYRSSTIAPLRDVPSWLDAAVRRCLSVDPAARFPSLVDFADVVTRGLHARSGPRLLIGGIAVAALLASGATYLALRQPAAGPACAAGAAEIASTWNATTRRQLAHLGEPALRALDQWTSAWAIERNTTCRASEYEPSAMTAARNRCLDRRREEAAALIAALARVNAGASDVSRSSTPAATAPGASGATSSTSSGASPDSTARGASGASDASGASGAYSLLDTLAALPSPEDCAAAASDPADPIPIDKARAAIVLGVQRDLAALRATLALGDARPILDASATLVETARSSQHAPTLAEAELLHADALRATSQLDAAVDAVRAAAADAERGHADQLAARIWLARVAIAGDRRDLASADDLIAIASGAIDRAGAPERLVATLLKHRGLVAYNRGALDDARRLLTEAHAMLADMSTKVAPIDTLAVDAALTKARTATDTSGATTTGARAVTTTGATTTGAPAATATGPTTTGAPAVTTTGGTTTGAPSEVTTTGAPAVTSDALAVTTDLGATIERIAVESALGSVERAAGNLDAAESWHQRAYDADRALRGEVHPDIARDLHNLAGVARLRGDLALAFERYSQALAI